MVVMLEVQVPIMQIVGVVVVRYGLMPTRRAVQMTMASVFVACTFHRINLHSNQIANGVQENVGMTAQLNPVLVLLIRPSLDYAALSLKNRSVYRRVCSEHHLLCKACVSTLDYSFDNRCYHHCRCARWISS
jgi:hypothetical protein